MFQSSAAPWRKFLIPVLLVGGLLLAACAPDGLQFDASLQSDDTATVEAHPDDTGTPEATHTPGTTASPQSTETLEPTHTPEAGATGAPDEATHTPEATGTLTTTVGAEIEFRGTLTAVNGNTWTVNGLAVLVSADTEIEGNPQVGDEVKVEGALQADGSVRARQIKKFVRLDATATPVPSGSPEPSRTPEATRASRAQFRGVLTAVNGNTWTVNGIAVVVSADTEIKGNPQVGNTVKVEGALQADGSVLAREIEVEAAGATATPLPGQGEVEFEGTLTAINGNTWTVNGVAVIVNANTEIEDNPQIGDTVKVEGTLQADGSVLAREIKKDHSGSGGDDNSGPGDGSGGDDDHSGSGGDDDNSGSGGGDDHSGGGNP